MPPASLLIASSFVIVHVSEPYNTPLQKQMKMNPVEKDGRKAKSKTSMASTRVGIYELMCKIPIKNQKITL